MSLISERGPRSVADRLSEVARRSFVGRETELAILRSAVQAPEPPFMVAFIHGPGGIGKSGLIAALWSSLGPGVQFVALDGREIEPTPRGFIAKLGAALGFEESDPDIEDVVTCLEGDPRRTVLALDTYETCGLIDSWLRQTFVPALPETVLTIMAGRAPPSQAWLTTPGWRDLFHEIELRALAPADAERMLVARGLDAPRARRVNRFERGHPLALELAAAAIRERPDLKIDLAPPPKLLHQLTQAFVAELPEETIEAVEAASTVRRITEPILGALLQRSSTRETFERLRLLPFADLTSEGLIIHDLVRETLARDLAQCDPGRYADYRWRAWRLFTEESQRARGAGLWHPTADLLYLITNPSVREGFSPRA